MTAKGLVEQEGGFDKNKANVMLPSQPASEPGSFPGNIPK
jgi:hypothetical protein